METYALLKTVPVFADVRRRVRRSYHSLKHVHTSLRLGLQLVEVFFQLVLLFSWPLIILCYFPIVITDRILHDSLAFLLRCFPTLMEPVPDIYGTMMCFILSFTIGRVIVFFILFISYLLSFMFDIIWWTFDTLLFIVSLFREEKDEPFQELRFSPPPTDPHSSRNPHGHAFSPVPPSEYPTIVLPGNRPGPVHVVEAVAREVSIQDVGPGRQLEEPLVLRPRPRPVRMVVPTDRPLQCVAQ